jgi:hypothetical protein
MGTMFRRYWIPALLAAELAEPDGPPVRVQILSEKLIAFRDTEGRLGLIDEFCAHRRVSLWFGRNEECGLRRAGAAGGRGFRHRGGGRAVGAAGGGTGFGIIPMAPMIDSWPVMPATGILVCLLLNFGRSGLKGNGWYGAEPGPLLPSETTVFIRGFNFLS